MDECDPHTGPPCENECLHDNHFHCIFCEGVFPAQGTVGEFWGRIGWHNN